MTDTSVSSGSESAGYTLLKAKLGPFGRVLRIDREDWPDIYYTLRRPAPYNGQYASGWVECKYISEWPVKPETPIRIPRFTEGQAAWLKAEVRAGGRAFLMVQIEREYFFFDGATASILREWKDATRANYHDLAALHMESGFVMAGALKVLAGERAEVKKIAPTTFSSPIGLIKTMKKE